MLEKKMNKRALYESIMKNVAKTVKRTLNLNEDSVPWFVNTFKDEAPVVRLKLFALCVPEGNARIRKILGTELNYTLINGNGNRFEFGRTLKNFPKETWGIEEAQDAYQEIIDNDDEFQLTFEIDATNFQEERRFIGKYPILRDVIKNINENFSGIKVEIDGNNPDNILFIHISGNENQEKLFKIAYYIRRNFWAALNNICF